MTESLSTLKICRSSTEFRLKVVAGGPVKRHRNFDIRMQTLMDRASQCSSFQTGPLRMIGCHGQINIYLELTDPAYRLLNHCFRHFDLGAFQRNRVTLCENSLHSCHTTSKRGS